MNSLRFRSITESILYFSPVSCVRISHKTARMGTEEGSVTQTSYWSFFEVFRKWNAQNWYAQTLWTLTREGQLGFTETLLRRYRAELLELNTVVPSLQHQQTRVESVLGLNYLYTWFSSVYYCFKWIHKVMNIRLQQSLSSGCSSLTWRSWSWGRCWTFGELLLRLRTGPPPFSP